MSVTVTQIFDKTTTIRSLSEAELQLGLAIFRTNLSYHPGESVLIVTDAMMLSREATIWFEAAKQLDHVSNVTCIVLDGMVRSGQEPPAKVIEACSNANITLLHTTFSLTHTQAGKSVMSSSHRGFSLPGVNHSMMMRTLTQDYRPIQTLGLALQSILSTTSTLRIFSPNGTKLTTGVRQEKVYADVGFVDNGEIGNLPAGEVFFAPLDETTQGIWVVDGSMADFEETGLDEPIAIEIERGRAVDIRGLSGTLEGGKSAQKLYDMLSEVGPDAFHVAEIGIGINRSANPYGDLIEAEKAYATAHLALGNSSAIGGSVDVPIHLDGVSVGVDITTNEEKLLVSEGNFLLD